MMSMQNASKLLQLKNPSKLIAARLKPSKEFDVANLVDSNVLLEIEPSTKSRGYLVLNLVGDTLECRDPNGNSDMNAIRLFASLTFLMYLVFSTALGALCRESAAERAVDLEKIKQITAQLKLEPKHSFLYVSRGQCYVGLEDWDKALADTNVGIKINSTNSGYFRCRAGIYGALGKSDMQKADLDRALDLEPTEPENFKQLALYFGSKKNFSMAYSYLSKAIALRPTSVELHLLRAEALKVEKRFPEAISDCDAAFKMEPGSKNATMVMNEIKTAQENRH